MGSDNSKIKYNYNTVKDSGDFLQGKPVYGEFLISMTLEIKEDKYSPKVKTWLESPKVQIIIQINNIIRTCVLEKPKEGKQLFTVKVQFNQENFAIFQKPLTVNVDYNNFKKGFQVSCALNDRTCYLKTAYQMITLPFCNNQERIVTNIVYCFIGKNLLNDVINMNLPHLDVDAQVEALQNCLYFSLSGWNQYEVPEISTAQREFSGGTTIDSILTAAAKTFDPKFDDIIFTVFEDYKDYKKKFLDRIKGEPTEENKYKFPENLSLFSKLIAHKKEYQNLFKYVLETILNKEETQIYQYPEVYKEAYKLNLNSNEKVFRQFVFPEREDYKKLADQCQKALLSESFFFDIIIEPLINQKDMKLFDRFQKLLKEKEFFSYFISYKEKYIISEDHPKCLFLKNLLETPEFQIIPLKVFKTYGHQENWALDGPLLSFMGEYIVSFKKSFYTNQHVVGVVAQQKDDKPFFITHLFFKGQRPPGNWKKTPVEAAIFFTCEEVPSENDVKKYYSLSYEAFFKKEFPEDGILKPLHYFDLREKNKTNEEIYEEFALTDGVKCKFLVCVLRGEENEKKPFMLDTLGCLGYGDQSDSEKFGGKGLPGAGKRLNLPDGPYEEKEDPWVL